MSKELVITKTIADKICQQLMNGIPLARISKDKDMPGLTRIYKEIAKNKEFQIRSRNAEGLEHKVILNKQWMNLNMLTIET